MRDAEAGVRQRGELNLDERVAIRQAATYAINQARDMVNKVYHEAGSTAIFDRFPIERRFRDINAVSQQLQGRSAHLETVGQYLMDMPINQRWL